MDENIYRIITAIIFFSGIGISGYYRHKADRDSGETISRNVDGAILMNIIQFAGLLLWLSPLVYIINPRWMAWATLGLPDLVRWLGAGFGVVCIAGIYWLFSSIGSGITPTSATRKEHKLTKAGPYRYIRHPLYTIGSSFFITLGLVAANWFISLLGILAFVVMAIRTPKEEANLIKKFGDEYRNYIKTTGRFLPRACYELLNLINSGDEQKSLPQ